MESGKICDICGCDIDEGEVVICSICGRPICPDDVASTLREKTCVECEVELRDAVSMLRAELQESIENGYNPAGSATRALDMTDHLETGAANVNKKGEGE